MAFAVNLRRGRLERFLSQSELARLAGIHAVTITRLESGKMAPSLRTVRALASALGVEPRMLAEPEEVAELRRTLGGPPSEENKRLRGQSEAGGDLSLIANPELSLT